MDYKTIAGPLGPFSIPARPQGTSATCERLSKQLWAGEYDDPKLPKGESASISTVLDIGAAWGAFSVWALAQWPTIKRIDAFEPHVAAASLYRTNVYGHSITGSHLRKVQLCHLAVTIKPEPVEFRMYEDWGMCSTHFIGNVFRGGYVTMVNTFDPKDLPPADLVKIDAEGVESEIILSYPYLGMVKILLVEHHSYEHRENVHKQASLAGLNCIKEDNSEQGVSLWVRA